MAQQIINVGATPNDGTGDPIRTAFIKSNNNFSQLYSRAQVTPPTSLIGQIGDEAGMYAYDSTYFYYCFAEYDGSSIIWAQVTQVGNISTNQINSGNSNVIISGSGGNVVMGINGVTNAAVFTSTTANLVGNVVSGGYFIGDGSLLTGLPASYANANVTAYAESGWGGNIVPSANATYNLGSATNQWKSLYVSNTTIYLGNVPLGIDAGNVLTVNGNAVLTNGSNANISTTGNIEVGGILTDGYYFANGSPFVTPTSYGNANVVANLAALASNPVSTTGTITAGNIGITGSGLAWANASIIQTSASDFSITGDGQVTIRSLDGTYQWTFDNAGNLTLPRGGVVYETSIPGGVLTGNTIALKPQGGTDADQQLLIYPTALGADANHLHLTSGNLYNTELFLGNDDLYVKLANTGNILINTNDSAGNIAQWTFGTDSVLTFPRDTSNISTDPILNIIGGANPTITSTDASLAGPANLSISALTTIFTGSTGDAIKIYPDDGEISGDASIQIWANVVGNTQYSWTFGDDGNLTLPGNTFAVNYANGTPVSIGGGGANTGNVTFSGETVIGTGTSNTISGLYLAPDPGSLANSLYLRVRGNVIDEPTHIHFDTGNNAYFNQFIGDDLKYIQLANTGNIVVNSNDATGNSAQWTFDTTGNLTFPTGNLVIISDYADFSNAAVVASVDHNLITFSTGANGGVSSLWVEDLANAASNIAAVYANPTPGSNIVRIAVGQNGSPGPNLWDFGADGNLTAPGNVSAVGNVTGAYILGNGSQLTDVTASVPSQTILPTIQTITVEARPAGLFGGGTGGANVTVANAIPVTEYGVIITDGTVSEKYKTGSLGSIPGTVSLTFTTGLNSAQFTVFAYVTSNAGTYYSNSAIGTSGICLLAGTQIALSDGSHKAIEDITYLDKLLSWDFDRGCYAETTAVWIKRGETGSQYNLLTFSDGTTLRTFDQHRIFNKQAGAFTYPMTDATPVGTVTVNEHGQEITLTNKQVIVDTIEYYNVITDHHMNLFSDTVLTSCRFNNIYPITDMKFVKDGRTLRTRAEFENIPDRFFYGLRLAEQTTDIETVEWYVNRLLRTEVSTESELTV